MTDSLSPLLAALRAKPLDARLDQLEPRVWERIARPQLAPEVGAWRWRAGLAAAMLAFGALTGGAATARATPDASPFAVHLAYAPSTLLEPRR